MSVGGKLGRQILRNYLIVLSGGTPAGVVIDPAELKQFHQTGGKIPIEEAEINTLVENEELGTVTVKGQIPTCIECETLIERGDGTEVRVPGETSVNLVEDGAQQAVIEKDVAEQKERWKSDIHKKKDDLEERARREAGWQRNEDEQGVFYYSLRTGEERDARDMPRFTPQSGGSGKVVQTSANFLRPSHLKYQQILDDVGADALGMIAPSGWEYDELHDFLTNLGINDADINDMIYDAWSAWYATAKAAFQTPLLTYKVKKELGFAGIV